MSQLFQFGERLPQYDVLVLNEREARAGAGILFAIALVAFMNAWLTGDFAPTKLVILAFFIDFVIRVLVNPRYSPSLIAGRFAVRNQQPEYVGAPQKRFAWSIGLALATVMVYLVVLQNVRGPINIIVCALCLLLLFFETAFGICIGCMVYNAINKEKAQLCPGNVCAPQERHAIQRMGLGQIAALIGFVGLYLGATKLLGGNLELHRSHPSPAASTAAAAGQPVSKEEAERCKVPAFAVAIGHVEQWKLHNNCK